MSTPIKFFLLLLLATVFLSVPQTSLAQQPAADKQQQQVKNSDCPDGTAPGTTCLKNPLTDSEGKSVTDIPMLIGRVIQAFLGVLGSITLFMMVKGGATWLTSGGSPEAVKKGRDTMLWAAVGVFLILASYFAVDTYLKFLLDVAG